MGAGARGADNPPINSAKPYDEASNSTNCPLIAKHSDRNYHIFVLHRISFASVSTGGLCLYQVIMIIYFVLVLEILRSIMQIQLQKCY